MAKGPGNPYHDKEGKFTSASGDAHSSPGHNAGKVNRSLAKHIGVKANQQAKLSERHREARQKFSIFSRARFRHVRIGVDHQMASDYYKAAKTAYEKKNYDKGKFFAEVGDVFAKKAKAASRKYGL